MRKTHTPLSLGLAAAAIALILVDMLLPVLLPPQAAAALGSIFILAPIAARYGSLKTMRLAPDQPPESAKARTRRRTAAYARVLAAVMIVDMGIRYATAQKASLLPFACNAVYLTVLAAAVIAAVVLTILNIRARR